MDGSFLTSCEAEVKIELTKLNFMAQIVAPFHVTSQKLYYNIIFGQDIPWKLDINLDFQNNFAG